MLGKRSRHILPNSTVGLDGDFHPMGSQAVKKTPTTNKTKSKNRSFHGNPKPSFFGVITHILRCKTFIFHGFWVQGFKVQKK